MSSLLDKLKERLEKHKQEQTEASISPIEAFMLSVDLEAGNDKIESFILFEMYLKYLQSFHLPMTKIDFFRKLSYHIPRKRWGKQRYYLVNRTKLKLTESEESNFKIQQRLRKLGEM